ncbi:MAG: hypothetical protein IJW60_03280 [Clostridia bacterium]|nr:hypothetical protein [Clostridia bacterium]
MKMKKLAVLTAAITAATCTVAFASCGGTGTKEQKVMNLSLNPEVEFVLDADDKVVSVNALNEEGNLIVSAEVFTGKTAEEAAKLFVEVSKETGFLVSGKVNAGENELEISFSGDTKAAESLYNDVKSKVNEYFTAENITATVEQATAIGEEQLEALVAECAPYLEAAEIQAMEYKELVETLAKSRQETAEFYSQELKNAYYEAKAFAMEQAELQAVKTQAGISGLSAIAFDTAYGLYTTAIETIESTRLTLLVNENSPYQLALKAFREAKTDYLNYRNYVASLEETELTTAISEQLASYQTLVDSAETALLQAGETANTALDTAKVQVKTAYNSVVAAIEEYSAKVSEYASQIATKQQEAQTAFFNDFETSYAAAITAAKNNWQSMKTQLEQGENAE